MLKEGILDALYAKRVSPMEFNFETLTVPSLYNFISEYEIGKIYDIVTSIKYSAQLTKKKDAIKAILSPRGFMPFASGTNRMCFRYLEDKRFIIKVPYKESGLDNGFREFRNQNQLKPFVTKTFDVHPSGCISQHERVLPITNREEYMSIIDDVFAMLTALFGNYVLEDVGTKYFMNIGIRSGFGVVIIDYPDLFELDGKKLFCNRPIYPNTKFPVCGGLIDVDDGFNCLVCKTCGKEYTAASLQKAKDEKLIIMEGDSFMKVALYEKGKKIVDFNDEVTDTIVKPKSKPARIKRPKVSTPSLFIRGEMEEPVVVEEYVEKQPTNTGKITPISSTTTIAEPAEEPKVEEVKAPTRTVYSEEQTNTWINDLCVELSLTQEEMAVAEMTITSHYGGFSYYNKEELRDFFTRVRDIVKARQVANEEATTAPESAEESSEPADTTDVKQDEIISDEHVEEPQEEEAQPVESIEEHDSVDSLASEEDGAISEYEDAYIDDEVAVKLIDIYKNIPPLEEQPSDSEEPQSDSFVVGNNSQEEKQETNETTISFKSRFLVGRDTSQY